MSNATVTVTVCAIEAHLMEEWSRVNEAGNGEPVGEEHDECLAAVVAAGWTVLEVAEQQGTVLARDRHGRTMLVCGDHAGVGPWACDVSAAL